MPEKKSVQVVDLFAGPGGLAEGFSNVGRGKAFKILVSAEMEKSAHQTLVLRTFFRILKQQGKRALGSYYKFCNGESNQPWDDNSQQAWQQAVQEARCITLGTSSGNRELNSILKNANIGPSAPWVLLGGPPCQAYSLIGRARNRGIADYNAEEDERHYLYKEYLKTIRSYQPAVFVMENVKGILSSKVNDKSIFPKILRDLSAGGNGRNLAKGYRIHSLVARTVYDRATDPYEIDFSDFLVKSENYGIPQARHRVILLGIREDIDATPGLLKRISSLTVEDAISDLPPLRSRISSQEDSPAKWAQVVTAHLDELHDEASSRHDLKALCAVLKSLRRNVGNYKSFGMLRLGEFPLHDVSLTSALICRDKDLRVWLNHEARGHMPSDLRRYLFAASFAKAYGRSPKGHEEFSLEGLKPSHKNWETGKFSDRFRVQVLNKPATTVTSHIAKDGHYFIHPDPTQCRSLTVREAARLQTFPDNYFFMGNRTQQFHQVGNAVPPLLAEQIAKIVFDVLTKEALL